MDVVSKNTQSVLRGPKCAKKISPTPKHHRHQPEPVVQGRMDPVFHANESKSRPYHPNITAGIKTHQTSQYFPSFLLFSFGELNLNFIVFI